MGHAAHALTLPDRGRFRHRPEDTALYQAVAEHWPAFQERADAHGGLPKFVVKELGVAALAGRGMFKAQAEFLSAQLGGALGSHAPGSRHTRAGEVNAAAAESAIPGFEATLGQLLDGTFSYSDGVLCLGADRDLAIAYCVRNRGGHHTAAARIVRERFEQVLDAMLASLCHCVEQLYPACSSV